MPNYGTYASLGDIKSLLGITDTTDDALLLSLLVDASRKVDEWSGPFQPGKPAFAVLTETRYYGARRSDRLLLDRDLLSITTLKTDEDGDRTYERTWAATDYDLEPANDWPKWEIRVAPYGRYSFPYGRYSASYAYAARSIEIVGQWGYGDGSGAAPYEDTGGTAGEAIDASETAIDVSSGALFSAGQTLLIGSEQMYVRSISTNTLTVWRGVNGTTVAAHDSGSAIYRYVYPDLVRKATLTYAVWLWSGRNVPGGMAGSGEISVPIRRGDLDARDMVRNLRGVRVG